MKRKRSTIWDEIRISPTALTAILFTGFVVLLILVSLWEN